MYIKSVPNYDDIDKGFNVTVAKKKGFFRKQYAKPINVRLFSVAKKTNVMSEWGTPYYELYDKNRGIAELLVEKVKELINTLGN